jgi:hypothetical protein
VQVTRDRRAVAISTVQLVALVGDPPSFGRIFGLGQRLVLALVREIKEQAPLRPT